MINRSDGITKYTSKGGICIEEYHCMYGFGGEV